MECPDENVLLDVAEGLLSGADLARVRAHAEGCRRCGSALRAGVRVTSTLFIRRGGDLTHDTVEELEPVAADAIVGTTVGEYTVDEVIGLGGMGIVYRAHHPLIGKSVAIKVLRRELAGDDSLVARMLEEARAVSAIGSAAIADVFGFGALPDGRRYMVMEHLEGQPLSAVIAGGALPFDRVLWLLDGLLAALVAAHRAGVIHRDLKPSNVFLVRDRSGDERLKLLDFGLAKREAETGGETVARHLVIGTPGYMAPEQIRVEKVSVRTDLYSVGVIAWELAAGRRPYRGADPFAVMRAQLAAQRPALRELRPQLPGAFIELVDDLLEVDPAMRPDSAQHARERFAALRAPVARRRWPLIALGGAAVVAAVAGAAMLRPSEKPTEPAVVAQSPTPPVRETAAMPPEPPPMAVEDAPPPEPEKRPHADRQRQRVVDRLVLLRRKAKQRAPAGEAPDAVLQLLLDNGERDLKRAKTAAQLQQVETTLDEVERKYLR